MELMLYSKGASDDDEIIICTSRPYAISEEAYEELAHAKLLDMLPKRVIDTMEVDGEELVNYVEVYELKDDTVGLNPFFMNSLEVLSYMLEDGVSLCGNEFESDFSAEEIAGLGETIINFDIDYISLVDLNL